MRRAHARLRQVAFGYAPVLDEGRLMPFTLVHPIAVVPLARRLRGRTIASALVIGSMVPDLWNVFPTLASRDQAHSVLGLFEYSLPLGLLCYVVFHLVLARPLVALLPSAYQARLAPFLADRTRFDSASLACAAVSVLLGAVTHIAWDSFTHAGAPVVDAWPLLREEWLRIGSGSVPGYRLLQTVSTVGGAVGLGLWGLHWSRSGPARPPGTTSLDPLRAATLAGIAGIGFGYALHASMAGIRLSSSFLAGVPLRRAAVAGLEGLLFAVLAFSVAWHLGTWADRLRSLRGRAR